MPTDEPTGTPDEHPEERRDAAADPWVAPSPRADGAPVPADGTPTSSEPLPVVPPRAGDAPDATPTAAYPPPTGTPTAAYPPPTGSPTASYPPPTGTPTAAYPPAVAASAYPPPAPNAAPPLPYGPPPTGIPPAGDVPPQGPVDPGTKRGNPVGLIAFILGVLALVLAVLPIASFVAGLPALAAIVLGIIGLVLAGRRRGFATAGLIIGSIALVVAIAFSVVQVATFVRDRVTDLPQISDFPSDFPSGLPSGGASGGGLAAGPHTVVYRVTGSGTASISYSTIANGRSASARDTRVSLPRTRTQRLTVTGSGPEEFVLAAISLDGKAKLGCSIEVDGKVIAHNTSSASSGVELVTCAGRGSGF